MASQQLHVFEPSEKQTCRDKKLHYSISDQLHFREKTMAMEDLGVLYSENLSSPFHAEKRAETAIKDLYTVKRNISEAIFVSGTIAFVSYFAHSSASHRLYGCLTKET